MNIKKKVMSFAIAAMSYFSLNLVSAYSTGSGWGWGSFSFYNMQQGPQDLINIVQNFFSPFFEAILGVSQFDQFFFERVLFLIMIFSVCYIIMKRLPVFEEKAGIAALVAGVISLLGARYTGGWDVIQAMLLPQGALFLSMAIILPFLLFFYFVHTTMESGAARRAAWIFFGAVYLGLVLTRTSTSYGTSDVGWIYNFGILAVLASLAFDKSIHKYFGLEEARSAKAAQINATIAFKQARIRDIMNNADANVRGSPTYETIKRLNEDIRKLAESKGV